MKLMGKLKQSTRKILWQEKFKEEIDRIYKKYEENFEQAVLEGKLRSKDVLNLLKIMVAPMRFGKTRLAITHHIPFLLEYTDVNCIIFTSPLGSILKQKERLLKTTISKLSGVEFCSDPIDAQEALDDNQKVVLVMTNMGAWVGSKAKEFFDKLDKPKTAFIIDEAHTWTTDSRENVPDVIGAFWKGSLPNFKAALYERVKLFSEYTPFIFGLTATTNNQHNGEVPALGNMQFVVTNSDFIDNGNIVKNLAYRLGWFDPERVRYMDFGLYGDTESYFNEMLSVLMKREKLIGQKLTCFIEAKRTEKHVEENKCLEEIKTLITNSNFKADNVDENSPISVIMTSKEIMMYNKNGEKVEAVDEKTVYTYLNDQNHPLRFLIVVDMAKMGVDLQSTKLLFSFRQTEKKAGNFLKLGFILEAVLQKFGRVLTPNSGKTEKQFFEDYYGDFRNVPNFHPEMNMTDFWIMDNGMNREGMEKFSQMFAPRMPDMESHLENCDCPTCGQPWPKGNSEIEDSNYDEINKFLEIK